MGLLLVSCTYVFLWWTAVQCIQTFREVICQFRHSTLLCTCTYHGSISLPLPLTSVSYIDSTMDMYLITALCVEVVSLASHYPQVTLCWWMCVCVCMRLCTCVCVCMCVCGLYTIIRWTEYTHNSVVYSRCFETCLVFLIYNSLPITGCLSNILEGSHTPADSIRLPFIIITNVARSQPSFSLSTPCLTHLVILWLARGLILTYFSAPPQTNIWDTCSELVVLPLYWDSLFSCVETLLSCLLHVAMCLVAVFLHGWSIGYVKWSIGYIWWWCLLCRAITSVILSIQNKQIITFISSY